VEEEVKVDKEKIKAALDGAKEINATIKELEERKLKDEVRLELSKIYEDILGVLKKFCDIKEEYYPIVAMWIIGTYVHDEFETFPYLFFNAMRGSGKTRILRLVAELSKNGELLGSMSESVLFRTAKGTTMCIDEFEKVDSQEKQALRELLNSAYKKGQKIKRMKKSKEDYVVEEFEVYTSVCMANIWGMEEVLGDRCITIILEKSDRPEITKLIENYTKDPMIQSIKTRLGAIQCSLCSVVMPKQLEMGWNNYILDKYVTYNTTLYTLNTQTTLTTQHDLDFYNKMDNAGIEGRHFELSFPLLIIARFLNNFEEFLVIIKELIAEKKAEDLTESKDIQIFNFISQQDPLNFIPINNLTSKFRDFMGVEEREVTWVNSKWIGRALKRLALIKEKVRKTGGISVVVDVAKAQEKMKMFQ